MKLVCPASDWKSAVDVTEKDVAIIERISAKLGLKKTYDKAGGKIYLDLPDRADEKFTAPKNVPKADNILRFTMHLPKVPSSSIIDGVITLNGQMYKACSGCVGGQIYGDYWTIAQSAIPPGDIYRLDLRWNYSDLTGIKGRFYHILPDPIVSSDGKYRRTEIGLHRDNGAPGTSGCIGVVGEDWSKLCNRLDELAKFNRYVNLEVSYKCRD